MATPPIASMAIKAITIGINPDAGLPGIAVGEGSTGVGSGASVGSGVTVGTSRCCVIDKSPR